MRVLVFCGFIAGCRAPGSWTRFEPCDASTITASITETIHPWTRMQIYRLGQYLGMRRPWDEMLVRVCNGTQEKISITLGASEIPPCFNLVMQPCQGEITLLSRQAAIANRFRDPIEDGEPGLDVAWVSATGARGHLRARAR